MKRFYLVAALAATAMAAAFFTSCDIRGIKPNV